VISSCQHLGCAVSAPLFNPSPFFSGLPRLAGSSNSPTLHAFPLLFPPFWLRILSFGQRFPTTDLLKPDDFPSVKHRIVILFGPETVSVLPLFLPNNFFLRSRTVRGFAVGRIPFQSE